MRLEGVACKATHLFGQTLRWFDETAGWNAGCWQMPGGWGNRFFPVKPVAEYVFG